MSAPILAAGIWIATALIVYLLMGFRPFWGGEWVAGLIPTVGAAALLAVAHADENTSARRPSAIARTNAAAHAPNVISPVGMDHPSSEQEDTGYGAEDDDTQPGLGDQKLLKRIPPTSQLVSQMAQPEQNRETGSGDAWRDL